MRLAKALSLGTEQYPEEVARGLRVLNFGSWCAAAIWFGFTVFYVVDDELRQIVIYPLLMTFIGGAVPLLHRFGPRIGAVTFVVCSYVAHFMVGIAIGTDSGIQFNYFPYAAGAILVLGARPIALPLVVCGLALGCIIALEFLAPSDGGLMSKAALTVSFVVAVIAPGGVMFAFMFYAVSELTRTEALAKYEFNRSEGLLANILPKAIGARLKASGGKVIADRHDDASVLFADLAGFTKSASNVEPTRLVEFLNEIFSSFDKLVDRHGLEKIKTTGDNYMVVGGVPLARTDHAEALLLLAVDMLETARHLRDPHGHAVSIRIGIATGPVVAGVVGLRKFFYDVWGDAVNLASRMESTGVPGRIQVSPETYDRLKDRHQFEQRGPITVKGKGRMTTWLVSAER